MKNTNYFLLFIFLLFLMGCKKDDKTEKLYCGAKDTITEISWLATEIESMKANKWATEISYCKYNNGLEGFYVDRFVDDEDRSWWGYYDCEGNLLCGPLGDLAFSCIDSFKVISTELIWEYTPEPDP